MFDARKLRFATLAATPFTVTWACSEFTVPTTMSFTVPLTVRAASVVVSPSLGDSIARCGGVVSSVTCSAAVLVVPPEFVATAVSVLVPSTSGTDAVNALAPLLTAAGMPLMVTVALGSPTLPDTIIGLVLR